MGVRDGVAGLAGHDLPEGIFCGNAKFAFNARCSVGEVKANNGEVKANNGPWGPSTMPQEGGPSDRMEHAASRGDISCTQGARPNAWEANSLPRGLGTGMDVPATQPSLKRPAWNRPVVVPLPSMEELGAVRGAADRVQLDPEEVISTVKRFDNALVGRLFGKRIPFDYLNSELQKRWQGFGPFRTITISGDCFICIFGSAVCRDAVMMGGPWIVAGQVIGIDRWSPGFSPSSKAGIITPVWIRLPSLPLYCWGGKNIARIASGVGAPLWMDSATDRLERGQFARVCVRLDLSEALKPGIWVDGPYGSFFQKVEYEGLSSFCFHCGHVGHKALNCTSGGPRMVVSSEAELGVPHAAGGESGGGDPKRPAIEVLSESNEGELLQELSGGVDVDSSLADSSRGFGPWMLVQRRKPMGRLAGFKQEAAVGLHGRLPVRPPTNGSSPPGQRNSKGSVQGMCWKENIHEMDVRKANELANSLRFGFQEGGKPSDLHPFANIKEVPKVAFVERAVAGLGPVVAGGRIRKRKTPINLVGGGASPLVRR